MHGLADHVLELQERVVVAVHVVLRLVEPREDVRATLLEGTHAGLELGRGPAPGAAPRRTRVCGHGGLPACAASTMIFFSYGQNTIGELWKLKILRAALPLGNRGDSQVASGHSHLQFRRKSLRFEITFTETHFRDEPSTVHIVASNFANELRANPGFDKFVFMRV